MKKGRKLIYFIIGLFLGILSTSGVSLGYLKYSQRQLLLIQASIQIKAICQSIAGAYMCDDRVTMTQLLDSVTSDDSVIFAGAYNNKGELLAAYYRKGVAPESVRAEKPLQSGYSVHDGYLKISEPVLLDGDPMGIVCVYHEL